ncbi:UDP-glucose flavonoid 3-O-glucosyltransferase 6-like [Prosopis cineraria]|uniref:UDP-glucose flavonoid 3-O-glucosyltransferase 6-like n=1 Tax=Prosopis cineraria TaxID=364024 RepID=UPI0024102C58|nr:UDP-glucose flavonoid 3-O-glucosyltransferase 6-like [Prosopis cineraria]
MFCTILIDVATKFRVLVVVFFTSGTAFLEFMLRIHSFKEQENVDMTALNFKDWGFEFTIMRFENHVLAYVFPGVMSRNEGAPFFLNHTNGVFKLHLSRLLDSSTSLNFIPQAKCVIVDAFKELEHYPIQSFFNIDLTVYPMGPISSSRDNKTVLELDVMEWLDDQPPSSVLFLCFRSVGYSKEENQVMEIARTLEASGIHFICGEYGVLITKWPLYICGAIVKRISNGTSAENNYRDVIGLQERIRQ